MNNLPESLKLKLSQGKYSKWAADIDEDTLYALLWFVGELSIRCYPKSFSAEVFKSGRVCDIDGLPIRSHIALEAIVEIFHGRTFRGIDDIRDYIHGGARERQIAE